MQIFVLGATGWIGGAITDAFIEAGHVVTGLVRSTNATARLRIVGANPIAGDLTDHAILAASVQAADVTIYAASAPDDVTSAALAAMTEYLFRVRGK